MLKLIRKNKPKTTLYPKRSLINNDINLKEYDASIGILIISIQVLFVISIKLITI